MYYFHRLATKEVEHGAALSGAASAYRQESQHRIDEAVERARHEEKASEFLTSHCRHTLSPSHTLYLPHTLSYDM